MSDQIGPQNLAGLLPYAQAVAVASVGPEATATSVPLADLGLSTSDLTGGWALFEAGAFGVGSAPTLAPIDSNTSDSLAFAADVLASAPLAGYRVWLYQAGQFNVTVNAPENVEQWGGADVEAADASGVVAFRLPYSESVPGENAPARAVQVAGTDGTDSRVLLTDSQGRFAPQPSALVWDAAGVAVAAATNVFGTSYQPPTAGRLRILIGNLATGAASVASLVKTANAAPSGGSAGTRIFALNGGTAIGAGDLYPTNGAGGDFAVTPNDSYNIQFATATTVDITATFYPAG